MWVRKTFLENWASSLQVGRGSYYEQILQKSVEGCVVALRVCRSQEPVGRSYRAMVSGLGVDFEQRECPCGRVGPFLGLGMTYLGGLEGRTLTTEIQGRWPLAIQPHQDQLSGDQRDLTVALKPDRATVSPLISFVSKGGPSQMDLTCP